jgi:DNA-binding SARP family transcriptional activator
VSEIRLRILGESVIEVGENIVEPSATHVFALLLYLAIERGRLISRSQLASMLFPDGSAANAGHNLRQLLYRLRRIGVPLETTTAAVRLPFHSVVQAPESMVAHGRSTTVSDEAKGFALLPSYAPPTEPLSRWLEAYRDQLSGKLLRCLARDLARARDGADWSAVERIARGLLELDPLNETATLGLAEALARSGSKHRAIEMLHAFADDVGQSHSSLALPSRLLTKRISEAAQPTNPISSRAPLIGRTEELRSLTDAWSHARRGNCTIAVVTGEKSIGKSRVLEELAELVRMDGSGVVLTARTRPADSERPMSLFSDVCAALLALPGAAGCNPDSLPHLRRLQGALGLASDTHRVDIDAIPAEGATRRAIVDLLESVSSERPLLLCVDDADQLDDSSRDLLASLPQLAPSLPLLLVATGNRMARLPQRRDRTTRLGPLTRENALALAHHRWGRVSHAPGMSTLEWCVDSAAGNPGHLDLLMRHTASLRDTPAAPPDLIALLDSRIESLSPAAKHALQACVVFGADCCPATIATLTGLARYDLLLSLESLVEAGVVIDAEQGISCRSSLLAERVRSSTTPVVSKLLHWRAALHLQSRHAAQLSQATAWRIADHWQAAGDRIQALEWRRNCWRQLLSIGQPSAAAENIRGHLEHASSNRQRAELLDDLILALQYSSDVNGQLAVLAERLALCDSIGDPPQTRIRLAADLADARFYNYEDTTSLLPELQTFLASADLDEFRRLRVARILMVTADQLFDAALACSVYVAMPKPTQSLAATLLKDQVELIYHSDFGVRDEAVRIAKRLNVSLDKVELSPASISAQLAASLALHIVDSEGPDTGNLERLFGRCLAASMNNAAVRISIKIASIHFDFGEVDSASLWCDRATQLIARSGIKRLGGDYLTLRIDLAVERGDIATAQTLIDIAPQHFPAFATPRASREYLVYRTFVDQSSEGRPTSSSDIERLADGHDRAKHFGRHDDHMQVFWTALWRAGRRAEASRLLREYLLVARRERRPANFRLRSRTAEDPIWEELK